MSASLCAQEHCGMNISSAKMQRASDLMVVKMDMQLEDFDLKGNRVAVFTPAIVGENDSLRLLRPVGIYSRDRWFQYLRSGDGPVSGPDEKTIRWSKRPEQLTYAEAVPYTEWMSNSQLVLLRKDYACCQKLIDEASDTLSDYREVRYMPIFRYASVAAEIKTRELSGRAYIDFPVSRTEIYPDYRNNRKELAKIIGTIDSVRNDADITVTAITIKGFASPESPWSNNTRLAKGRTATLKQYVCNLYKFDDDFIATDYCPEDWDGLREFVEKSNLEHRTEILALIDDNTLEPDPKEAKLKSTYPAEYKFLLATVYPALRHSDYTIEYTIRSFTDINEIDSLFHSTPQKLSLNEMMRYAQTLEPGSDEYNEVFETAVKMFPGDEAANLNAANSAMQRGDLAKAEKYLAKAGDSAEAVYARGVLAALRGDYDTAVGFVEKAGEQGLDGTAEIIDHIKEAAKYQPSR